VFSTAYISALITESKWGPFGFILIRETEKSSMGGGDNHVAFDKKFHAEKGSVGQCIVMMQQPVLLSPKFGTKSSLIFMLSP
jgi:hypothetical protein